MKIWIMDKPLLSIKEIMNMIDSNERNRAWKPSYIPFAGDNDSLLIIDQSQSNAVFEWSLSDGIEDDSVSDSLGIYLETYRNSLLNGNCEYIDGVGIVEKVGSKPTASGRK